MSISPYGQPPHESAEVRFTKELYHNYGWKRKRNTLNIGENAGEDGGFCGGGLSFAKESPPSHPLSKKNNGVRRMRRTRVGEFFIQLLRISGGRKAAKGGETGAEGAPVSVRD